MLKFYTSSVYPKFNMWKVKSETTGLKSFFPIISKCEESHERGRLTLNGQITIYYDIDSSPSDFANYIHGFEKMLIDNNFIPSKKPNSDYSYGSEYISYRHESFSRSSSQGLENKEMAKTLKKTRKSYFRTAQQEASCHAQYFLAAKREAREALAAPWQEPVRPVDPSSFF